jgi:hypothetical protein
MPERRGRATASICRSAAIVRFHIEKVAFRIVKNSDAAVQQKIPPAKILFRIMEKRC